MIQDRVFSSQTFTRSLRRRILAFVGALVILSLLGSTISLYRITEVNRLLDAINRFAVPLGRLFTQLQVDSSLFQQEFNRNLGSSYWEDPHWRPKPIPRWITDVLESEVERMQELIEIDPIWNTSFSKNSKIHWQEWREKISKNLKILRSDVERLYTTIEQGDLSTSIQDYALLKSHFEEWERQLQWGVTEFEQLFRKTFSLAQERVTELRTGLEMILLAVICLSLLLLWLGERALRPLGELSRLVREITRRGLQKGDKSLVPEISLSRKDEVSQLASEFYTMATTLLEREKTVELQKYRLIEQNRLLSDMMNLQERLRIAEHMAAVGRMSAQVAHEVRNPLHSIGLEAEMAIEQASRLKEPQLKQSLQSILAAVDRLEKITENYLKLSKLSAGEKTTVDMGEILDTVLATYTSVCETQGVRVDWKREPNSDLRVWGDRDLLEQVIGNLFKNSLQALESTHFHPPWIIWTLGSTLGRSETHHVWLTIEDNGPGVSPEIREKLFIPFVTTRAQGTGLGLSFIKRVIEDHGGSISYRQRANEEGACFEILLPGELLKETQEIVHELKENSLSR